VVAFYDRVHRVDARVLFSRAPRAEFLTEDKKNVVLQTLLAWRIVDPPLYLRNVGTRERAEDRLADLAVAEAGAILGRHAFSALTSTSGEAGGRRTISDEIRDSIARAARPTLGIEIGDVSLSLVALPDQNRQSVFERMKAERERLAKRYRSEGALEAKKIIAAADREKVRLGADAYSQAQTAMAEGDAEASRIFAAAFLKNPGFYGFLRTLEAYEKLLDESTTLVLPLEADAIGMIREVTKGAGESTSSSAPSALPPPPGGKRRDVDAAFIDIHPGAPADTKAPQ
jgi:membrane protease subunit HflC